MLHAKICHHCAIQPYSPLQKIHLYTFGTFGSVNRFVWIPDTSSRPVHHSDLYSVKKNLGLFTFFNVNNSSCVARVVFLLFLWSMSWSDTADEGLVVQVDLVPVGVVVVKVLNLKLKGKAESICEPSLFQGLPNRYIDGCWGKSS